MNVEKAIKRIFDSVDWVKQKTRDKNTFWAININIFKNITGMKVSLDFLMKRDKIIQNWRMNKTLSDSAGIRF